MTREMHRPGEPVEEGEDKLPSAEMHQDDDPAEEGEIRPSFAEATEADHAHSAEAVASAAKAGSLGKGRPAAGLEGARLDEVDLDEGRNARSAVRHPVRSTGVEGAPGSAPRDDLPDSSGSPVKFAVFAVFYYAGKAADRIVSIYSKALELDREYVADFNRSTGVAHAKRGHWGEAVPLLEKALTITPDDLEARMLLAETYSAANQYEKAYPHLEKALQASPNSGPVLRALGVLCSRRQDFERAIEYLEKAVELDPDDARSFYRLGAACDNGKLYGKAVESFRNAIRLDPRFARAHQALGFTYESMGDRESAVECFKKALELE